MKINPPLAIIDEGDPFKNALFGRKEFGDSLASLLKNVSDSLVIFVNAPWGEGKTTFALMWREKLRKQNAEVVYFDAYAADYFDDPFVSFSGEILAFADIRLQKDKGLVERKEFKETAVEVGKRLAGLMVKVGLRAATMGVVETAHLNELKEIASEVATGVSEIGAEIVEKRIEGYSKEKDALKGFKKSLTKLAAVVRQEQGFPLTIIVDELDRCRPDFALSLLERIKHLFDVEGVAFVLLVNRDQIEGYIRTVYGEKVDARAYLLKFANLFVELPSQAPMPQQQQNTGRENYCHLLLSHYGFAEKLKDGGFFIRSLGVLVEHFNLTLREMEKVFATLALYYASLPQNQLTNEFFVVMLAILKLKKPELYKELASGQVSAARFFKETALDQMKKRHGDGVSQEWVKNIFDFCLMSDDELTQATKSTEEGGSGRTGLVQVGRWLISYNLDRERVIPFFCRRLDSFSVSPER